MLDTSEYSKYCKQSESVPKDMLELIKNYNKAVKENMTPKQLVKKNVSKQDPKYYSQENVDVLMTSNIV